MILKIDSEWKKGALGCWDNPGKPWLVQKLRVYSNKIWGKAVSRGWALTSTAALNASWPHAFSYPRARAACSPGLSLAEYTMSVELEAQRKMEYGRPASSLKCYILSEKNSMLMSAFWSVESVLWECLCLPKNHTFSQLRSCALVLSISRCYRNW